MKKFHFLHPLIYTILPTLILYSHNIREAWPSLMVRPMGYSLVFGLFSWLFSWLLFRDKYKASILTSIWLILFFFYGHVYLFVSTYWSILPIPVSPHAVLLGSSFLLLILSLLGLWKAKKPLSQINAFLTVASLTMLLINLVPLIPFEISRVIALQKLKTHMANQHIKDTEYQNTDSTTYPDIYYIVFDRYGEQEVLSEYFNYDNSTHLESLRQKDFFVADKSFANYPTTFLSLSSSLNMSHLTFLSDVLGDNYSDESILYQEFLNDSETVQFLKSKGYQYFHLGSSWEASKRNTWAEENINLFLNINEFESFLFENTLYNAVLGKINREEQVFTGVKLLEIKSLNAIYKKEHIKELSATSGPKLVFAHYLLPHPPYLYASDCTALSFEEVRKRTDNVGYIDQLQCANKIMNELSKSIKENASRPIVIIFQSDEGPFLPREFFNDTEFIDTPNKDAYKIHGRILNAMYLSDKNNPKEPAEYEAVGLRTDSTPVNTFRMIFNYYFGSQLPMQEDRSYYYTDNDKPYQFTEITDDVW